MNKAWWIKMAELDDRQREIFDIPIDSSHLITGPPGCGKTNLLLLRASQLVKSGKPNVLVLVFTRTLKEFLATGASHYAFGAHRIQTLNHWAQDFIHSNGGNYIKYDKFEEQRKSQAKQALNIVDSLNIQNVYDAIILDEAQDYSPEELDLFFRLSPVVFAAADERQTIYLNKKGKNNFPGSDLTQRFGEAVYKLKHHYRNGHKICEIADSFAKVWGSFDRLLPTSNYDEDEFPSSANVVECVDLEEQVKKASLVLRRQVMAYPGEFLGVLCPNNRVLNDVWALLSTSPVAEWVFLESSVHGHNAFSDAKPICLSTIHSAKGLEFRTVHIMASDQIKSSPLLRQLAYTATTRAKSSLSFYHTGILLPFIESALTVLKPNIPVATLDQLFPED